MTKALGAGLDNPGIPLRAFLAPLAPATRATRTLVTIEVGYPVPQAGESAELDDELRLGILVLTPDAKVKRSFQRPITLTGKWKPTARGTLVINEAIDLPDDDLVVRVGISSKALGRTGTTHLRLDVPNLNQVNVQLAPLVLGIADATARGLDAAIGLDAIRTLVPFQPTTHRSFASTDRLRVFSWAYWKSPLDAVAAELRVDGRLMKQQSFPARTAREGRRAAPIDMVVPLAGLSPGRHVITMTGSTDAKHSSARQVAIDVK
jgi:hypothetical protein